MANLLLLQVKNNMWWKITYFHTKTNVLCSTTAKFYFTLVFFSFLLLHKENKIWIFSSIQIQDKSIFFFLYIKTICTFTWKCPMTWRKSNWDFSEDNQLKKFIFQVFCAMSRHNKPQKVDFFREECLSRPSFSKHHQEFLIEHLYAIMDINIINYSDKSLLHCTPGLSMSDPKSQ